jgi:hypothetical protein
MGYIVEVDAIVEIGYVTKVLYSEVVYACSTYTRARAATVDHVTMAIQYYVVGSNLETASRTGINVGIDAVAS